MPRFFGPTGPGPFALLGLEPGEFEPAQVLAALHARLAQLAQHPQFATPSGEEVSLALHAAAAQLCDPVVRRVLLRTWGSDSQSDLPSVAASQFPSSAGQPDADIERDLHLAVGLSGGWNARAMERLAMACQAKGVDLADAVRAVQWAGTRTVRPGPAQNRRSRSKSRARAHAEHNTSGASPRISRPLRARPIPLDVLILAGIGCIGVVFLATAIILLTPARRPAPPSQPTDPGSLSAGPLNITVPTPRPTSDSPSNDELASGNPRAVSLEIVGATHDLATDASVAGTRFARAYDAFGKSWTLMSADEITSIVSAIVDYCYGASRLETPTASSITAPLHANLGASKASVRAAAGAASVAGRLLSERELPRAFLDAVEAGSTFGNTRLTIERSLAFRVGLERNLAGLAAAIASSAPDSADAWQGFVEVRDAALGDRQPAGDVATLNALELLLRHPNVSARDLVRSVGVLAASLSWRPSDELRTALSGWLEDAAVPSESLTEVTRAMVASSAPGVDSTMVLPLGAGPEARSNLRERIAEIWQGKSIANDREDFADWARWAESLLYATPDSDVSRLWTAARLSRAIHASEAIRAGRFEDAVQIKSADSASPPSVPPSALPDVPGPDPHSKALEYAAALNSVQARLEILKQLETSDVRPDSLLADALVTEAARGSPASTRELARAEVRKHATEPAIVLATLKMLAAIPETPENAGWVSEVAGSAGAWKKRPKWKEAAQLALLDRAIALFPVSTDEVAIDAAALELADSWFDRAGDTTTKGGNNPSIAIESLETAMATAARAPRGGPPGLRVADIRRRLAARADIAPGPIERVVARQAACVEWTALAVATERPGDIAAVQQIIEQWNIAFRSAHSSTEQLLEGEKAMLRLQFLRVGRKVGAL